MRGRFAGVIERSLGDPASYAVVESRSGLLALVREEGEPGMETTVVASAGNSRSGWEERIAGGAQDGWIIGRVWRAGWWQRRRRRRRHGGRWARRRAWRGR